MVPYVRDPMREAVYRPAVRRFDMRELSRTATWALVALAAVTLATLAASTPRGEDRLILAVANFRGVPPPERLVRRSPAEIQARNEARQLAEAVRNLSENRDQLLARLETIERNVSDITSSIRAPKPASPAVAAVPPPEPAPEPVIATPAVAAPVTVPIPNAKPEAPAEGQPTPAKNEFGIDLGRASTVEGLRQLWTAAKNRHTAALEGLHPVVTVRELARSSGVELRLVAGPIPNAAAAARLCASLPGQPCHPTVFDGQRLVLR